MGFKGNAVEVRGRGVQPCDLLAQWWTNPEISLGISKLQRYSCLNQETWEGTMGREAQRTCVPFVHRVSVPKTAMHSLTKDQ